jgi:hypothetical protein
VLKVWQSNEERGNWKDRVIIPTYNARKEPRFLNIITNKVSQHCHEIYEELDLIKYKRNSRNSSY